MKKIFYFLLFSFISMLIFIEPSFSLDYQIKIEVKDKKLQECVNEINIGKNIFKNVEECKKGISKISKLERTEERAIVLAGLYYELGYESYLIEDNLNDIDDYNNNFKETLNAYYNVYKVLKEKNIHQNNPLVLTIAIEILNISDRINSETWKKRAIDIIETSQSGLEKEEKETFISFYDYVIDFYNSKNQLKKVEYYYKKKNELQSVK